MAGPRDFLKRAEYNRRLENERFQRPIQPVPVSMQSKPQYSSQQKPPQWIQNSLPQGEMEAKFPEKTGGYRIMPKPIGGHGIYRELMRSHDRMGTQHIPKQG